MTKNRSVLISAKLLGVPIAIMQERGIPSERIFAGQPFGGEAALDSSRKLPWSQFVLFFRNMEKELGGPEAMVRVSARVYELPGAEVMHGVIRKLSDLPSIYWASSKMAHVLFPCARGVYEKLPEGRLRITLRIDEHYEDCPQFFRIWLIGLRSLPQMLGLPESIVEVNISPRLAVYTITPPPSRSLIKRVRTLAGSLFAAQSTINELSQQKDDMERYYEQLLEAQQKLQEQEAQVNLSAQIAALSNLAALGEMAAAISHEINNPLMILYLQAGLLRRRIGAAPLDEAGRTPLLSVVQEIEQTGSRISAITRGLLAFAGETHNETPQKVTLCTIVRDAMQLCGEKLRNAGIRIEVPPPTPVQVSCRRAQISHAFVNLLNNAYDALQAKPRSERWIRIEYSPGDMETETYLAISDSGPGVPADSRGRIFEPFFTTRELGKATGLGLSVAKGLVDTNGGRLVLDEASEHTRFVITLPAAEDAALQCSEPDAVKTEECTS